jgi:hypothetical protein
MLTPREYISVWRFYEPFADYCAREAATKLGAPMK